MVQETTSPSQQALADVPASEPSASGNAVKKLLVGAALTIGFLMAPTLQGISLVADQSQGASKAMQAADAAASDEVGRLIARP